MGPTLRRLEARIRCFLGDHELVTDVVPAKPADEDGQGGEPARLRLRCLFCPFTTPGWEQGPAAYRRTYAGGPTAAEREAAELATAVDVAAAGGGVNVAKFRLAKKRRTR